MGAIVGKHVFGSLYGIEEERAYKDEEWLRGLAERATTAAGATIVESKAWKLPGKKGGVSVIVLVEESHIAVHTWAEYSYVTVDIYTCGEHTDPWRAWELMLSELRPRRYTVNFADRSQLI